MRIKGKTVLITGGASGIGRIMGRIVLEKGAAALIIWDINEANLRSATEELGRLGKVYGEKVDVSRPDSIQSAYEAAKTGCPQVDLLINCAGIITNNRPFHEQTDADILRTMDINASGTMLVTLRFLRDMVARDDGHVCNITSAAGMLAMPKMSLYTASKWASIGWSESVRIELERQKSHVRITTVAPYFINTGMFDGIRSVFKIQDPETVAKKVIRAVERDKRFSGIPFSYHFIRLMQGIFPVKLFDPFFGDLFGLYRVMDHYTGRKS